MRFFCFTKTKTKEHSKKCVLPTRPSHNLPKVQTLHFLSSLLIHTHNNNTQQQQQQLTVTHHLMYFSHLRETKTLATCSLRPTHGPYYIAGLKIPFLLENWSCPFIFDRWVVPIYFFFFPCMWVHVFPIRISLWSLSTTWKMRNLFIKV